MWSRVILTRERIEEVLRDEASRAPERPSEARALPGAIGARVEFQGIVRDQEPEGAVLRRIAALDYEAHEEMAVHQLQKIVADLGARLPILAMLVIHRIGVVPVGEASLFVRIDAPHRAEALEACAAFIDELKQWVPIWKHAVTDEKARGADLEARGD